MCEVLQYVTNTNHSTSFINYKTHSIHMRIMHMLQLYVSVKTLWILTKHLNSIQVLQLNNIHFGLFKSQFQYSSTFCVVPDDADRKKHIKVRSRDIKIHPFSDETLSQYIAREQFYFPILTEEGSARYKDTSYEKKVSSPEYHHASLLIKTASLCSR